MPLSHAHVQACSETLPKVGTTHIEHIRLGNLDFFSHVFNIIRYFLQWQVHVQKEKTFWQRFVKWLTWSDKYICVYNAWPIQCTPSQWKLECVKRICKAPTSEIATRVPPPSSIYSVAGDRAIQILVVICCGQRTVGWRKRQLKARIRAYIWKTTSTCQIAELPVVVAELTFTVSDQAYNPEIQSWSCGETLQWGSCPWAKIELSASKTYPTWVWDWITTTCIWFLLPMSDLCRPWNGEQNFSPCSNLCNSHTWKSTVTLKREKKYNRQVTQT